MANDVELREKLDALQGQLSSRRSTTHYARSAIMLLASLLLSGASGKTAWDAKGELGYQLAAAVAFVALCLLVGCVIEYLRGRSVLKTELVGLEQLKKLRQQLRLDDPASLLPSR